MSQVSESSRRHDLDALRAIAMLLGILLHSALSFATAPWIIQDSQRAAWFDWMIAAIHGFRMPLFFLLSGFFTAMLWRGRGLKALFWHRAKRIFLPFVVCLFSIIPLMFGITVYLDNEKADAFQSSVPDLWQVVYSGNSKQFEVFLQREDFDADEISPDGNSPILTVAAFLGHHEIVHKLIVKGADVNLRSKDGGSAIHAAAFLGRWKSAELLIDNGIDLLALNAEGQTPADLLKTDWATTKFVADLYQVPVDREAVFQGRERIAKMLTTETGKEIERLANDLDSVESRRQWIGFLTYFPLFFHLWFLWFLCLYLGVFFACGFVWNAIRNISSGYLRLLIRTPLCLFWLVPLTMIPQAFMDPGVFGPDTSVGLLPIPRVWFYYAIFFFFGVVYWDSDDAAGQIGTGWVLFVVIAIVIVFPTSMMMLTGHWGDAGLANWTGNFMQSLYAWLMILGAMGMFRRFFSGPDRRLRYVSDSSYWLYIAHLPLVMVCQWAVRDWSAPASLKFLIMFSVVALFLLFTYQYMIRYSFVGTMLNGKRFRESQ